jgi:hypothetical protein
MVTRLFALLFAIVFAWTVTIPANAADLPKRKSGLWEIATQASGHSMTMQVCVDEKSDDLTAPQSQKNIKQHCSKMDAKRTGNQTVIDSVCQFEGTTATSHTVVSGDMASQYTLDSTSHFSPAMHGISQSHTVMTGKWIGPCKPGQKNGDVSVMGMPAGGNMQITPEMMKQMQKMRQQYGQ